MEDVEDVEREVRKLRKKLRQVERLLGKDTPLTEEEVRKVAGQDALRCRLQKLVLELPVSTQEERPSADSLLSVKDGATDASFSEGDTSYEDFNDTSRESPSSPLNVEVPVEPVIPPEAVELAEDTVKSKSEKDVVGIKEPSDTQNVVRKRKPQSQSMEDMERLSDMPSSQSKSRVSPPLKITVSRDEAEPSDGRAAGGQTMMQRRRELRAVRTQWLASRFSEHLLEGHNDIVTCADCDGPLLVTGSRDTTVRVWDTNARSETYSLGGHTGSVTCLKLLPRGAPCPAGDGEVEEEEDSSESRFAVSGSTDCSVRVWDVLNGKCRRSIYTFSPVQCLDFADNVLATGSDGGKVLLWSWPSGEELCSVRVHEEALTCIELRGNLLVTGDVGGCIRLWQVKPDCSSLQPRPSLPVVRGSPAGSKSASAVDLGLGTSLRPVQCVRTINGRVYFGDDGANVKVVNLQTGSLHKLANHCTQFGSTDCIVCMENAIFTSAFDLDTGEGFLNVRSLDHEEYLATIVPENSVGHIRCLACASIDYGDGSGSRQRWCVGGDGIVLLDLHSPAGKAGKKSKLSPEASTARCSYLTPLEGAARDSDVDFSSDNDSDLEVADDDDPDVAEAKAVLRRRHHSDKPVPLTDWWFLRWCSIL